MLSPVAPCQCRASWHCCGMPTAHLQPDHVVVVEDAHEAVRAELGYPRLAVDNGDVVGVGRVLDAAVAGLGRLEEGGEVPSYLRVSPQPS